uniref:EH domain-containing protein n=1 Tax=Gongylonema pulchrum TaxID=637853 RepID=A0A183DBW9_9BILA
LKNRSIFAGFILQNGGVVPPSLLQEGRVPRFYHEAIARCGAATPSQLPNTGLVYNLMVTSRLPRAILGNIWSLVNRTLPGQLTRQEFFSCLALIALVQKGQPLSALSTMTSLPIPHLQACAPMAQYLPRPNVNSQKHEPGHPQTAAAAPNASNNPAAAGASLKSPQTTVVATSNSLSLLSDINFS